MTKTIRIDVNGDVTRHDGRLLDLARAEFDGLTAVVTLTGVTRDADHHEIRPLTPEEHMGTVDVDTIDYLVAVVHDMGVLNGMSVNPYAWALYGRSPLCGPAYVALDSGEDLPEGLLTIIEDRDRLCPPEVMATMAAIVTQPGSPYRWGDA